MRQVFSPPGLSLVVLALLASLAAGYAFGRTTGSTIASQGAYGPESIPAIEAGSVPSPAEHDAAVQATAECMRDAGLSVVLQPGAGLRPSRLGFEIATLDEAGAAEAIVHSCRAETGLTEIEIARATDPANHNAQKLATALSVLADCLARNGVAEDAQGMTQAQLSDLIESLEGNDLVTFALCADRAEAETGLHP